MLYLSKTYKDFLYHKSKYPAEEEIIKENKTIWIAEKVNCLRQKINQLRNELSTEYNPNIRKKKQMEIKICELKIMIANIK